MPGFCRVRDVWRRQTSESGAKFVPHLVRDVLQQDRPARSVQHHDRSQEAPRPKFCCLMFGVAHDQISSRRVIDTSTLWLRLASFF